MPPRRRRQKRSLSAAEEEGCEASPRSEERGQDQRAEVAEEAVRSGGAQGGNGGGGGGEQAARMDSESLVKMDLHVLDCTICCEPLRPPIYQCEVGHAVCFVCRAKLLKTCPICCREIGFCRCFALEQMVDAVKVPCSNAYYGCKELIIYHQKKKRETTCVHAPCFCPEDGCSFKGSTGSLLDHFVTKHKWSPTKFSYYKALKIYIPRNHRFTLLVGEDPSMFLVVNTPTDTGNAVTTICIRPHESLGSCYLSKSLAVHRAESDKGRYVFQMDPHVGSSSLHDGNGVKLGRFFLLVPRPELVDECGPTNSLSISASERSSVPCITDWINIVAMLRGSRLLNLQELD